MRKFLILILSVFLIAGCSKLMDKIWEGDEADFDIKAETDADNQIRITFTRSDHNHVRDPGDGNGTFFRGYYIYRTTASPFSNYSQVGIEAYSNLNASDEHIGYQDYNSPAADSDGNSMERTFVDSCETNMYNYYRVVVVYRSFNGTQWGGLQDEAKSSWSAALCITSVVPPYPNIKDF